MEPASGIHRLPYEIAFEIFAYLDHYDLLALSQVSKVLNVQTVPSIYRSFDAKINFEKRGFTSFLKTIKRRPDLASYVKHISTSRWLTALSDLQYDITPGAYMKPHPNNLGAIIHTLWNLKCLTTKQKKRWIYGLRRRLFPKGHAGWPQAKASAEIADTYLALLLVLLPNLESLEINVPALFNCSLSPYRYKCQLLHTNNILKLTSSRKYQGDVKLLEKLTMISLCQDLQDPRSAGLTSEFLRPLLKVPTLHSLGLCGSYVIFRSHDPGSLHIKNLTLDEESIDPDTLNDLITECRQLEDFTLRWSCTEQRQNRMSMRLRILVGAAERVDTAIVALEKCHSSSLKTLILECRSVYGCSCVQSDHEQDNFWLKSPIPARLPKLTTLRRLHIDQDSLLVSHGQCEELGVPFGAQLLHSLPASLEYLKITLCTSLMIPILLRTSAQRDDALRRLQHVIAEFFPGYEDDILVLETAFLDIQSSFTVKDFVDGRPDRM